MSSGSWGGYFVEADAQAAAPETALSEVTG
jgi:hypothetical protein